MSDTSVELNHTEMEDVELSHTETEDIEENDFTDPSTIVPPASMEELIERLLKIFDSDSVNVDYVKALMNSYKSNKVDWARYAVFDLHRYTRNLVHQGNGKFNLMLLCWSETHASSIHDHANSHCFMKCLDGELLETQYHWPDQNGEMHQKCATKLKTNETAYIHDNIGLHRVENPSHVSGAVSLHLYSPPFDECSVFDENTGRKFSAKVTFWTKFGTRTELSTPCSAYVPENN